MPVELCVVCTIHLTRTTPFHILPPAKSTDPRVRNRHAPGPAHRPRSRTAGTRVRPSDSAPDAPCVRQLSQGHRSETTDLHTQRETDMATTARPSTQKRVPQTSEVGKLLDLIKRRSIQVVDVKFCDLPGTWQHFSIPASTLDEEMIREGLGFDGSSHPRLPGDQRERHAPAPGRLDRVRRSGARGADALAHLRHLRPAHARALLARPPLHRVQGGGVPQHAPGSPPRRTGDPRPSSSSSTRVRFDQNAHEGYYHIDSEEGDLELGPERRHAQPGPPAAPQGGLLPGAADRPAAGRALRKSCSR